MISEEYNIVSGETAAIEWAAASLPKEGEKECADLFLIHPVEDGFMFAVVDGLGHGSEAVNASRKVVDFLKNSGGESLESLVQDCHEQLKGTRGAVLSLALLDLSNQNLSWLSIGNVEAFLLGKPLDQDYQFKQLVLRSGVVGYNLPHLNVSVEKITPGDLLFFTTDGVKAEYIDSLNYKRPVKEAVKYAAKNFFKNSDDSLILAIRFKSGLE